jgi:glucokinase
MKQVTLGIDVGGTNTVFGIVDRQGNIVAENGISTQDYNEVETFLEALNHKIKIELEALKGQIELKAIGAAAPNANFYQGTIEFAPNLKWGHSIVRFAELIQKSYAVPVFITNDANAAALGEMIFGAAQNIKDFLYITLGTGVGSGIVANGELVYGHDGFAGEVGHVTVDYNGRQCGCGRKGCLETYASATGIRRTVYELLASSNAPSELRNIAFNQLTAKKIHELALQNDEIALLAFDYTAQILGKALANSVAYTSPKAIFLFGGLANSGDILLKPTKKYMEENVLKVFQNKVEILPSGLKENVAILGASALAWKELGIKN